MTNPMRVDVRTAPDPTVATAVVRVGDREAEAVVSANRPLDQSLTPWVPTCTVMAMANAAPIEFPGAVDETALAGSKAAQEVLHSWFPDKLGRVECAAAQTVAANGREPDKRGVGCFFSGGVDSFYSAISHDAEVTHLILVHGLDISLSNWDRWAETEQRTREIATALGKELIVVQSNVRTLHAKFGPHWQTQAHGAFLANIALLLAPTLRKVFVPSSHDASSRVPLGTHPDLDPHWSSSAVEIVHDDAVANRVEKLESLRSNPAVLQHLRVCWANLAPGYNCGRCEKCLRTMIELQIVGALKECQTFPDEVPVDRVRKMYMKATGRAGGVTFATENLRIIRERRLDEPEIEAALEHALNRGPLENALVTGRFYAVDIVANLVRFTIKNKLRR